MRDAVREHLGDPAALALAFHEATVEQLDPWHQATKDLDRGRIAEMQAAIDGVPLEPTPEAQIAGALAGATAFDADALRWFLELLVVPHAPDGAVRPTRRVRAGARAGAAGPPPAPYGPDRTQLLELVTPMIVFVHGNPETAAIWDPLIAALGRDDVVALSPPGFGAPTPDGWAAHERRLPGVAGRRARAARRPDRPRRPRLGRRPRPAPRRHPARSDPVLGHRHRRLRRPRVRLARHGPGLADAGRRRGGGGGDGRAAGRGAHRGVPSASA